MALEDQSQAVSVQIQTGGDIEPPHLSTLPIPNIGQLLIDEYTSMCQKIRLNPPFHSGKAYQDKSPI
jgi:hypothetical protein